MEDITIYKQDGTALLTAPITDDSSRQWQLMGENHVRLVWNSGTYTPLPAKSYIEYKGERFTLLETYYPEKKAASHYAYDVKFQSVERLFVRNIFFRHVTVGETTWREPEFTLNSNLKTIADIIIDSLNSAAFGVTFSLPDGNTYADTGLKALSFSGVSLYNALTYIAEQWETEWWIENGTTLHFDRCEHGDIIELGDGYTEGADGVWESAGLLSVPQSTVSENIPQRVYAYGSDRNMTRQTTEDGGMNVSYAKRLRLDTTAYPGGYIEVENVTSGIEKVKMFDDIYPRRVGTLSSVRSVEQDGMTVWYVADAEIPSLFDPKEQAIPGTTMMMKFESGYLNGFEFEVNWHPENGEWEIINRQDDDVQIPFGSLVPRTGDTYSLFNIVMPEEYISLAQEELAAAAQEYVDGLAATVPETTCESEPLYWQRYGVTVEVGSRVRITGGTSDDGKVIDSRVTALSYSLTDPCSVQFSLSSGRATGRLAQMADTIAEQTAQIDGLRQTARAVSRNSWQSSQELSRMLDSLMKELVLVGSEEGQFVMSSGVTWDNSQSTLTVTKGKLVHTVYDKGTQHGQWTVQQASFDLTQPQYSDDTPYYIYIRCSVSTDAATVLLSASKKEVDGESGYYCFLAGILSSKYLGSRVYNSVSGLTQIAGGTITTQILQDPSRNLIIDFSSLPPRIIARGGAVIQGKIQFTSGEDAEESLDNILGISSGAQSRADEAYNAASDAQDTANTAQSTADDALSAAQDAQDYIDNTLPSHLQSINAKLDGVVENWFEPYTPTRSNAPASTWIADGDEAAHEGDTFTNTQQYADDATTPDAGKSWRWVKGADGTYSWTPIADSDAVKALQQAAKAQDTADQKRRVFVVTPSTPYDVGDLWTQGTNGRTMRCVKARATGAYTASDWGYADNSQEYTDKSIASIEIGGRNLIAKRYLTDWNSVAAGITEKGSDDNGDYLLIDHNSLYHNIGGAEKRNDIFQGKIKYKENTRYAFRIKWRKSAANASSGMYIGVKYSDGTFEWLSVLDNADAGIIEEAKVTRAGKTVAAFITTFGTSGIKSIIYEIQLTEGTKQTAGWLVAPEDTDALIENAVNSGDNLLDGTAVPLEYNGSNVTKVYNLNTDITGLWSRQLILSFDYEYENVSTGNTIQTQRMGMEMPLYDSAGSLVSYFAAWFRLGANKSGLNGSGRFVGYTTAISNPDIVTVLEAVRIYIQLSSGTAKIWNIKLENSPYPTRWTPSANDVRAAEYLTKAIKQGSTDIDGGLLLTSLIGVRDPGTDEVTGGMSGVDDDNIAFWSGGTYAEAVSAADKSDQDVMPTLPVLLTKKGYGSNIGIFKVRQDDIAVLNSGVKTIISKKTLKEAIILMPIFRNDFDDAAFTLKGTWSKLATTPPRKTSYVDYTWISTTKQRAVIRVRGSLKASGNGGGTPGVALCLASFSCWIKEGTATTGKVVWYPKGAGFSTTGYTTVSDFGGAQESLRTKEFEFRASVELKANTRYSYYIGLSELTINGTGTITLDCSVEAYFDRIGDCCVICNDGMGIVAGGNRFFLQQETGKEDLTIIADLPDASASLQPGQMYNDNGTVKIK